MIPILFDAGETEFESHGLGDLTDAISCDVTHEINGGYELAMAYPASAKLYQEIKLRRIIYSKPNPYDDPEPFRIYEKSAPMSGTVRVYARHISYDMAGIPVSAFSASSISGALSGAIAASETDCPFSLSTTKTGGAYALPAPRSLWNVLGGKAGSLLDVYGGEWEFSGFSAKLKTHLGADRGATIEYGKNLKSFEQDANIEAMYTGVYPFWYDQEGNTLVTIPGKIVPVPGTFDTERIMILDLTDSFQDVPSESDIQHAAESYIANHDMTSPKVSISLDYVILSSIFGEQAREPILLGDTVKVKFPRLGVDSSARVVKTVYDAILDRYNNVSIGHVKSDFAQIAVAQQRETEKKPSSSRMEAAITRVTNAITGNTGGHIVTKLVDGKPQEQLIMDTEDETTATRIWRWNLSGFGYSGDGGQTYGLAMTMDGEIVADYITTGTLDADEVNIINLNAQNIHVNASQSVADQLIELSDRIDGAKNHYSVTTAPTLLNYPAWDFTSNIPCNGTVRLSDTLKFVYTVDDYKRHSGDLAFNSRTGLAYRFALNGDTGAYYWMDIADSDMGEILQRVYALETTAEGLTSTAQQLRTDLTADETKITQNATSITAVASRASTLEGQMSSANTRITQTADSLRSVASRVDDTEGRLTEAESSIEQNATAITSKVSTTDYTGMKIASLINQSASTVKIQAQHINLEGALTISAFDSSTAGKINSSTKASVPVYYRSTVDSVPTISASTSITLNYSVDNEWTYVMPRPKKGTYFFTATRTTKTDGSIAYSTVRGLRNANYVADWCASADSTYIDGGAIYANSVTASQIAASAITAAKIAAGAITADKIAAGAITADKIAAGAITAAKVSSDIITTSNFSAQSINAGKITAGTLAAARIDLDGLISRMASVDLIRAQNLSASSVVTTPVLSASARVDSVGLNLQNTTEQGAPYITIEGTKHYVRWVATAAYSSWEAFRAATPYIIGGRL